MATITIELFESKQLKKDNNRHPIYITVRKDDVVRRKKIGVAFKEEWDDSNKRIKPKGRKEHVADTIYIEDEFDKYSTRFKELDRSGNKWHPDDVFNEPEEIESKNKTFFQVAEAYLKTIEHKSSYPNAVSRLEKVKRYSKDLTIPEIDKAWIAGFIKHCQTEEKSTKKGFIGNSKNTINFAFCFIRTVVNFSDEISHALRKHKLSYDKNIRSKLTASEIESIKNLEIPKDTLLYHSRNIFLTQYYFRGMRIGDALRLEKSDIVDGRLKYDAKKTGVQYDMKVVSPCVNLLSEYMSSDQHYIFPLLRRIEGQCSKNDFKNEMKNRTMIVNRHLKTIAEKCGITKTISTHIARHSFASIADQHEGGDLKVLQGLLGHSSREMTEIYIRDLRKTDDLDDAADKILG